MITGEGVTLDDMVARARADTGYRDGLAAAIDVLELGALFNADSPLGLFIETLQHLRDGKMPPLVEPLRWEGDDS